MKTIKNNDKDKIISTLWGIFIIGGFYWMSLGNLLMGSIMVFGLLIPLFLMFKWGYIGK